MEAKTLTQELKHMGYSRWNSNLSLFQALTSWLAKTAERQRQREERRKERMDRKRAQLETPKHKFTDANYDQQKNKVLENLDDAIEAGLRKNKKGEEGEEEKGVEAEES